MNIEVAAGFTSISKTSFKSFLSALSFSRCVMVIPLSLGFHVSTRRDIAFGFLGKLTLRRKSARVLFIMECAWRNTYGREGKEAGFESRS